jgi:uncharacterized protein (DUF779 family)
MTPDSINLTPRSSRAEVIESLRREYGEVTFFDSTTVIAGGKKHMVPEGTTYVSGQGRSSQPEMAFSSRYKFSPPGTEENVRRRKKAIEALQQQYGEVTFFDSTTVIAGGKKHQIPEGTVFVSAPSEWHIGPRGGIYKEWYSPKSGRSYSQYYR